MSLLLFPVYYELNSETLYFSGTQAIRVFIQSMLLIVAKFIVIFVHSGIKLSKIDSFLWAHPLDR